MAGERDLARESIKELMNRNPEVIQAFKAFNLACIGCAVQPFCTVTDAAVLHGLDANQFVERLKKIIENQEKNKKDG